MSSIKITFFTILLFAGLQVLPAQRPCCWTPDSMPQVSSLRDSITKWIHRYEKEIFAFEAQDDTIEHPKDPVLFVGSSSIRIWKTLAQDMSPIPVINRGFGGATLIELSYYAERVIYKYKPKAIVVYCGENDLAVNFSRVEDVLNEFKALNEKRKIFLPEAKVFFISIKPSPSRAFYDDKFKMANQMVQQYVNENVNELYYLDITPAMYDAKGNVDETIFKKDRLHMNISGYQRWAKIIKEGIIKYLQLNVK
jgi:lysophospholipase L1-like esterase